MREVCPLCRGRFVLDAFAPKKDGECELCHGTKFVNPEYVCECGRPGIRSAGALIVCTQERCFERALGQKKKDEKPTVATTTSEEDAKYWENMHGSMY